jgi:hypothetical protein
MIGPVLRREIESTFTVVKEKCNDSEICILCPECGDVSGHRSINIKTGQTFCFRCNKGANNKGSFIPWAKALGYTFSGDTSLTGISLDELIDTPTTSTLPLIKPCDLPKGFTPLERYPNKVYARLIGKMAKRKNLSLNDFIEVGAGYTKVMPWEPYCIFPVVDYDTVVYYQGRTYIDIPGKTTKRFPSKTDAELGASNWVYNIDDVREYKPSTVIIVESILNVLSLKKKLKSIGRYSDFIPVCVFKHFVSKIQVIKLLQCSSVNEFCLLFDHDAIDQTWNAVSAFSNLKRVTIAEMPMLKGNNKADANDDVDVAWRAIKHRKPYSVSSLMERNIVLPPGMSKSTCDISRMRICS